jgi:hypothetical protein
MEGNIYKSFFLFSAALVWKRHRPESTDGHKEGRRRGGKKVPGPPSCVCVSSFLCYIFRLPLVKSLVVTF